MGVCQGGEGGVRDVCMCVYACVCECGCVRGLREGDVRVY